MKKNIRQRGLKEGVEREGLSQYLEEVFTGYLGADAELVMQITAAYPTGGLRKAQQHPRDVLVKFLDWSTKQAGSAEYF